MEEGGGDFSEEGRITPTAPSPLLDLPPKVFIRVNVGKGGRVVSEAFVSRQCGKYNYLSCLLNKNNTPLSFSDRTILHQGFDNVESL